MNASALRKVKATHPGHEVVYKEEMRDLERERSCRRAKTNDAIDLRAFPVVEQQ